MMRIGPCSWEHMFGNWDLISKINCSETAGWDTLSCQWRKMSPPSLSFQSPWLWANRRAKPRGPVPQFCRGLWNGSASIEHSFLRNSVSHQALRAMSPRKGILCSKGSRQERPDRRFHFNRCVVTFLCVIKNTISASKYNFRSQST